MEQDKIVTSDLADFGYREYDMAGDLLKALANPSSKTQAEGYELGDGVSISMNTHSGNVFLVDEDYNVAMINEDGKLENWVSCSYCGAEEFKSRIPLSEDGECQDCVDRREGIK